MFTNKSKKLIADDEKTTPHQKLGLLSAAWKLTVLEEYFENSEDKGNLKIKKFDELVCDRENKPLNFIIWDATCHIMHELTGRENHNLFDKETIDGLASLALNKSSDEAISSGLSLTFLSEKLYLQGGIAIWNLLIPKTEGGIYPDDQYLKFINNLNDNLQKFWALYKKEIQPENLKNAFIDFKKYAMNYCIIEKDLNQKSNHSFSTKFIK